MMSLTIGNSGGGGAGVLLWGNITTNPHTGLPFRRHVLFPLSTRTANLQVVSAKRFSSRSGRLDNKNRRGTTITKDEEEDRLRRTDDDKSSLENVASVAEGATADSGYFLPELPGDKPDFWEGPQWEPLGFFLQYLWAFGIVFALIACGVAVTTYNEGATDFKETPAYKESTQSRELLEEPDSSNSDVFESNPTEVAPSLE